MVLSGIQACSEPSGVFNCDNVLIHLAYFIIRRPAGRNV